MENSLLTQKRSISETRGCFLENGFHIIYVNRNYKNDTN